MVVQSLNKWIKTVCSKRYSSVDNTFKKRNHPVKGVHLTYEESDTKLQRNRQWLLF